MLLPPEDRYSIQRLQDITDYGLAVSIFKNTNVSASLSNTCAYLHAFAVIEQDITELFGHHVQVPLLALMGPSQDVEFGEVGRQIIERPRGKQETRIYAAEKCWKHLFYIEDKGALTVWWWRRGHHHLRTQRGLLYIQTASSSLRVEAWKRTDTKCLLTF